MGASYSRAYMGYYWGYMGRMEKKMKTAIIGYMLVFLHSLEFPSYGTNSRAFGIEGFKSASLMNHPQIHMRCVSKLSICLGNVWARFCTGFHSLILTVSLRKSLMTHKTRVAGAAKSTC